MSQSSAWTPLLPPIPSGTALSTQIGLLADQLWALPRRSRQKYENWYSELEETWWKNKAMLPDVFAWLNLATGLDTSSLEPHQLLNDFLDIQIFICEKRPECAQEILAQLQNQIKPDPFGTGAMQSDQHNLLVELTNDGFETLDTLTTSEPLDCESTQKLNQLTINSDHHEEAEPEKKRRRLNHTLDSQDSAQHSWDIWNQLPPLQSCKTPWNLTFQAAGEIQWFVKCQNWANCLSDGHFSKVCYTQYDDQALYKSIVRTLREMRLVQRSIYSQAKWRLAVKESHLAKAIDHWCDPRGLVLWHLHYIQDLFRKNRIQEALGEVLERWTPSTEINTWPITEAFTVPFKPLPPSMPVKQKVLIKPKDLIVALKANRSLLPLESHLQSVYFLLSSENFLRAWHLWLGYALESDQYDLSKFVGKSEITSLYNSTKNYLTEYKNPAALQRSFAKAPELGIIVKRTLEYQNTKKLVEEYAFKMHRSQEKTFAAKDYLSPGACKSCNDQEPQDRCVQIIHVTPKPVDKELLGNGVLFAPQSAHIENSSHKKSILHPHDERLQLQEYTACPQILKRCKKMTYKFVDSQTDAVLDFFTFNAFSPDIHQKLLTHHERLRSVKAIKRGKTFENFSAGLMYGVGFRKPMGGCPGSGYSAFEGMQAETLDGLETLFDHAEDAMILYETARSAVFELSKDFKATTHHAEKIGNLGATLYLCENYTSPLHQDHDSSRGLSAQLLLTTDESLKEFAFIYATYGLYVVPQTNSLWSFNANDAHGTLLPSTMPLQATDPNITPKRQSIGDHFTARKVDIQAAEAYQKTRSHLHNRSNYWIGDVE